METILLDKCEKDLAPNIWRQRQSNIKGVGKIVDGSPEESGAIKPGNHILRSQFS